MTLDELKAEHARLVAQALIIHEAGMGVHRDESPPPDVSPPAESVTIDGVKMTVEWAMLLTRVAIYGVETQLEEAEAYA